MSGSVQTALGHGQEFLRIGNKAEAQRWLDRAHRLAPEDASIRLLLASALAGTDETRCRSVLLDLLSDYPRFREAQIALSAADLRAGDFETAIQRVSDLLRSNSLPDSPTFQRLADQLAKLGGLPGWIGTYGNGTIVISVLPSAPREKLELYLDGRMIWSFRPEKREHVQISRPLSKLWKTARSVTASCGGQPLLGSGVDLVEIRSVQGFVQFAPADGLSGWAWHPADPEAIAILTIISLDHNGRPTSGPPRRIHVDDQSLQTSSEDGPARLRGFVVPVAKLPPADGLRIVTPNGEDVLGSPIFPLAEQRATGAAAAALGAATFAKRSGAKVSGTPANTRRLDLWRPLPATALSTVRPHDPLIRARKLRARCPVDVVIPVFRGVEDFTECLASLRRRWPSWARLVVVDDGSPDMQLRAALAAGEAAREFILLRHNRNLGFPTAANTGLRHASAQPRTKRDVVLLNPDTLLPPGWLQRLVSVGYSHCDIGSVTPLTNQGTIVSYPTANADNPSPDLVGTDRLDALMRVANPRGRIDLPTAVGFCMFIRHDCLAETGLFREDAFAQGYGEENDWSLRAAHLGWRHVAATGIFVTHRGGRSFGAGKRHLLARNAAVLNRLHPGYDAFVAEFSTRDPLRPARFRVDALNWTSRRAAKAASVILITHAAGGGVERYVAERCDALRAGGRRPILLRPFVAERAETHAQNSRVPDPTPSTDMICCISDGTDDDYPNLRFRLSHDLDALVNLLHGDAPEHIEIHHLLGHGEEILTLIARLNLQYRVFIHDYAYWCPRITLCTKGPRYCGEPLDTSECDVCVMDVGRRISQDLTTEQLRIASARLLGDAKEVVVSCEDVAARISRHFPGLHTTIIPWEDEADLKHEFQHAVRSRTTPLPWRILIVGAIGADKGYDVLLACVRDAARRRLNLSFTVVGYTMDDTRLLDSGPVFITGAFKENEALSLAAAQEAHIGFIPSIWPETWCYTLSTLWRVGLPTVAFAFGAQGQRILRSGLGTVLPVGLATDRINDSLMNYAVGHYGSGYSQFSGEPAIHRRLRG